MFKKNLSKLMKATTQLTLAATLACLGVTSISAAPNPSDRGIQSPPSDTAAPRFSETPTKAFEGAEKVVGPTDIVGKIIFVFDDLGSAGVNSFGYYARERSLELAKGETNPSVHVQSWPAGEEQPLTTISGLTLVADNGAPELEVDGDLDRVHAEKTAAALDVCRQAAFLTASRPDKYDLVIQVKLRSLANFVQYSTPSWPNMSILLSEEFFSCKINRD